MFINLNARPAQRGFTLVEMLIAMGLGTIIIAGVVTGFLFCTQNMLAFSNYDRMNQADQIAIDKISREIRGLGGLTNYSTVGFTNAAYPGISVITNSTTFYPVGALSTNNWITYSYDPASQVLIRCQSGKNQVYLTNCGYFNFALFQRNQSNGTFAPISTTNAAMVKIVQMAWNCSMTNAAKPVQDDSLKSAQIVMRCK